MCTGTFLHEDECIVRQVVIKNGLKEKYNVRLIIDETMYETGIQIDCNAQYMPIIPVALLVRWPLGRPSGRAISYLHAPTGSDLLPLHNNDPFDLAY